MKPSLKIIQNNRIEQKLDMVAQPCNPITHDAEAEGLLKDQGHLGLKSEYEARLY